MRVMGVTRGDDDDACDDDARDYDDDGARHSGFRFDDVTGPTDDDDGSMTMIHVGHDE